MNKKIISICIFITFFLLIISFFVGNILKKENQRIYSPFIIAIYCNDGGYMFYCSNDFSVLYLEKGIYGGKDFPYVLNLEEYYNYKEKYLKNLSVEDVKILKDIKNKFPYKEPKIVSIKLNQEQINDLKNLLTDLRKTKPPKSFTHYEFFSWVLNIKFVDDNCIYKYALGRNINQSKELPIVINSLILWLKENSPIKLDSDPDTFFYDEFKRGLYNFFYWNIFFIINFRSCFYENQRMS